MIRSNTNFLIGQQIELARKISGKSKKEFSELIGYSDQTVTNWEQGLSSPKVSTFMQLFFKLGLNPDPFLKAIIYPEVFNGSNPLDLDDNLIRKATTITINGLPTIDIKGLHYILCGDHGEDYRVYINKYCANLHLPLSVRSNLCYQVISYYKLSESTDTLMSYTITKPDIEGLLSAYYSGVDASINGSIGYNVAQISEASVGEYMLQAREHSGKSVKDLRVALGASRQTIDKWESGTDEDIRMGDFIDYFDAIGENAEIYLKEIIDPACKSDLDSEEDKRFHAEVLAAIDKMDNMDVHRLLYILYGWHGSQTHYVVQEMYTDIFCEVMASRSATRTVLSNYTICEKHESLVNNGYAMPDLEILKNDLNAWDRAYL